MGLKHTPFRRNGVLPMVGIGLFVGRIKSNVTVKTHAVRSIGNNEEVMKGLKMRNPSIFGFMMG